MLIRTGTLEIIVVDPLQAAEQLRDLAMHPTSFIGVLEFLDARGTGKVLDLSAENSRDPGGFRLGGCKEG